MRKVTVSRMRKRYAQTVLTFRITYVDVSANTAVAIITLDTIYQRSYIDMI